MEYMVVYSTKTGNTKKVATEIFMELPGTSKDMQNLAEYSGKEADIYFVGFWTDQGSCDISVIDFLSGLHGKRVALFGTCGMGRDENYYQQIASRVSVWVPEDNEYLGTFLCQGKMPMQVRNKYEAALQNGGQEDSLKRMLQNFDEAMLHPGSEDLKRAREFVRQVLDLDK